MKTVLLCLLLVGCAAANNRNYTLTSGGDGGTARGRVPFDKPYELLTKEQQGRVMSAYEHMGAGDEPPFPLGGLKTLYEPITQERLRLRVEEGLFRGELKVDAEGNAVSMTVFETPSPGATKLVAGVALLTKFKPALCSGNPCAMSFPFRVSFVIE